LILKRFSGKLPCTMISKNIVKQPKSIVEVTITVPWSDLQTFWDQTLTRMAAEVELPGFRKGAAPLPMVEQNLGIKLQDEVLKTAMPNFLMEALKGTDIVPIDYPKYDLISFAKGSEAQFKATITNRPQVTVGNYKTIKVAKPTLRAVNDDEVNKVIDDLYKRWKAKQSSALGPQPQDKPQTGGPSGSISFQGGQPQAQTPSNGQTQGPDDTFAIAMGATNIMDLKAILKKQFYRR